MLDSKKIIELIQDALNKSMDNQSAMKKTFMQNIGGDGVSGSDVAGVIMNNVKSSCENMFSNMNNVFDELSTDVSKHQKMQFNENTNDFDVSKESNDKVSDDFKSELKEFFSKINNKDKDI